MTGSLRKAIAKLEDKALRGTDRIAAGQLPAVGGVREAFQPHNGAITAR